ncbi:MAG TPA: GAF domain-containing protein [Gemmatimonadales bacterium]
MSHLPPPAPAGPPSDVGVACPSTELAISRIVRQLNQTLELGRIVHLVARYAAELLRARRATIFVLQDDGLKAVGSAGFDSLPAGTVLPLDESFSGTAVRELRPVRLADTRAAADRWRRLASDSAADPRPNALAAPLLIGGRPIGAVCVAGRDHSDFDGADERLLATLADHAAIAVENARLYSAAARTARHASILAEAAHEIAHHVTPDAMYAGVARVAVQALRADGVCVYLADDELERVEVAHREGTLARVEPGPLASRLWEGAAERAARSGTPCFIPELDALTALGGCEHHGVLPGASLGEGAMAFLPLAVEGGKPGVLVLHYAEPQPFDEAERRLLGDFAAQATVGIRNASLIDVLERRAARLGALARAQQRERVLSEASAEIARLALGDDDLPTVAGALLGVVDGVVPCQALVLSAITEPDTVEYVAGTGTGRRLVGARVPLAESLLSRIPPGGEVVIDDIHAAITPAWRPNAPEGRAVLIPLVSRQRTIGMLGVGTPHGEPLDDAHVAELRRLAASMALAVDALLLAEEERRRTAREREMAAALATMDQPVLVLDLDGRIRGANQAAEREYGWTVAELTGMHVTRLAPSDRMPTPAWGSAIVSDDSTLALGRRSGTARRVAESVHRRRDGSDFPVSVTRGTIRDDDGHPVGHVLGVRNLTEERRVTEQLRQHERLAALGSLVAGVAHELNNPLTGISAFSQLLLEEGLDDEQTEAVRLIKREADRAVGVIRDLLLFSRKAGGPQRDVDVNAVLQLAVRLRTYSLRAERIEVELDLDEGSPVVTGDEQRLQQVFLNLIVNAEHAMSERQERRLRLRTRRTGAHLVVEVSDSGSGMRPEVLAHVFEPFFTTKPAGAGTGLGLSVSYGIVQAHGGTIAVDSTPGVGTTFRITLPLGRTAGRMEQACP